MEKLFSTAVLQLKKEMEYRNYSPTSVRSYCESVSTFEQYCNRSLFELTADDLKNYLHYLILEKKSSVSHINLQISAFKIFQTDILKKEWTGVEVKRPRREQKMRQILSLEEVVKVIEATQNLKHRVMLQVMYTAGLRRSELLNLKPNDIDSANGCIMVRQGKGKKDRKTLLSIKVLEELRLYYKIFRPSVYLFEPSGKKGHLVIRLPIAKAPS
jgi:integrase/recombinase XerD